MCFRQISKVKRRYMGKLGLHFAAPKQNISSTISFLFMRELLRMFSFRCHTACQSNFRLCWNVIICSHWNHGSSIMISYAHIANIYAYFSFAALLNWLEKKKLEARKMNQQNKAHLFVFLLVCSVTQVCSSDRSFGHAWVRLSINTCFF